ncbi:MAG: putative transcriptional regulator [Candidatus Omnitrophota bacterium]|jgi:predicted transcriptional regulator
MASESAFTVRLQAKQLKLLDKLASALDRSRNYIVNQAIDDFLDVQEWQLKKIGEGIKEADRGEFATDTKMKRIMNKYKK